MKKGTQRILAWSMMAALLVSAPLPAKERKGAQVAVELRDGSSAGGELLMVKSDGLVIGEPGKGVIVGMDDVRSVRIVRRSKAGTGFLFGLLGGSLIAYGVSRDAHSCNPAEMDAMMSALFVGLPAGLLGAIVGLGAGEDSILKKDEMQPEGFLRRLNRHARVPDVALNLQGQ